MRINRRILVIVSIIIEIGLFHNCSNKNEKYGVNDVNTGLSVQINDKIVDNNKIGSTSNEEKVKIISHWSNDSIDEERETLISKNVEKLAIGGHPLTITNIRGLEQLIDVRQLYFYAINDQFSDVLNSINVFGNLEKIIFENCSLQNLDFLSNFPRLTTIVFINGRIKGTSTFNFTANTNLKYFYFISGLIKGQLMSPSGFSILPKKMDEYSKEEKKYLTLKIFLPKGMKKIIFFTDKYPLIISNELLDNINAVSKVIFSRESVTNSENDLNTIREQKNITFSDEEIIDGDVPEEYQYKKLQETIDYEIVGLI